MARVGKLYTIPGRESGRLDVFIFCAGYLPGERMALDLLLSDIHAFFEVKIKGDGALVSDWLNLSTKSMRVTVNVSTIRAN